MTYMESTATNTGSATINVYFRQGFDPNMAAVDVQNRVSAASNLLPSEVNQVGVQTKKTPDIHARGRGAGGHFRQILA